MANPAEELNEKDESQFDVMVRLPSGGKLEDVERNALQAGIRPDRVEALITALRSKPDVKIGASVNRKRANTAKEQFTKAGLLVDVTSVLSLTAMQAGRSDGLSECPSCNVRVALPENRQCPNCGVFVDKVSEETLLRRKLREKEKAALDFRTDRDQKQAERRLREQIEGQLREEIRKELAAEMGLDEVSGSGLNKRVLLAGGVLAVVAVLAAFVVGRGASGGWGLDNLAGVGKPPPTVDARAGQLLDKIDKGAAVAGSTAAAAAANGGAPTGDPDVDDPLVQAAGGKRIGAKGISIEQAVAAAQTLAKAGGYKDAGTGEASAAASGPAAANPTDVAASAAGSGPGSGAAAAAPALSARVRAMLALDLTRLVAQMGLVQRAQGMLKAIRAAPAVANDTSLAASARLADLEIRAWALHQAPRAALRPGVEALLAEAGQLPDPSMRSKALMEAAVIAARHTDLPPETARVFLAKASEALPAIQGAAQATAMADWTVALGEVVLIEATARARAGQWARARTVGQQIDALIAQSPGVSAQARLHAIDFKVKTLLGQHDKLRGTLDAGAALVASEPSLTERAAILRSMARLSGALLHERMAAAIESTKAAAVSRSGPERAESLALLALLHADAGMRTRAGEFTQLALSTTGLGEAENAGRAADLLLRADIAMATSLHRDGLFHEAEAVLQRLAKFLL